MHLGGGRVEHHTFFRFKNFGSCSIIYSIQFNSIIYFTQSFLCKKYKLCESGAESTSNLNYFTREGPEKQFALDVISNGLNITKFSF